MTQFSSPLANSDGFFSAEPILLGTIDKIGAAVTVMEVRPEGRYIFRALNKLSESYYGLSNEKMAGREIGDFRGLKGREIAQRERAIAHYDRCVATRSQVFSETRTDFPDGTHKWARHTFVPFFNDAGEVRHIVITTVEITDLKRAQQQLEDALTRTLSGFVTICSSCKGIRHDTDGWVSIEDYAAKQMGYRQFTHGLCPHCYDKAIAEDREEEPGVSDCVVEESRSRR